MYQASWMVTLFNCFSYYIFFSILTLLFTQYQVQSTLPLRYFMNGSASLHIGFHCPILMFFTMEVSVDNNTSHFCASLPEVDTIHSTQQMFRYNFFFFQTEARYRKYLKMRLRKCRKTYFAPRVSQELDTHNLNFLKTFEVSQFQQKRN